MMLTATGGAGGTIYWQNTTSNGTSTATASASESVSATGTYYFRSQSAEGCWGAEGSEDVTINSIPTAVSVAGGGTQCGGTMMLTATGGTGGTIYWQNTTSNGTSTATASSSEEVSSSGTYYFRAQSAEGCWGIEDSETVTINTVPTNVSISGGGEQCGGTMTLTATGGTGGTIYWQNTTSDGTSTANASTEEEVSVSGIYYFRAQSAEGCWSNEGSTVVTIHPELSVTMSSTNESAPGANDGSVTFNFIGGTPNYFYDFASLYSETTSATTQIFPGLGGGTYCVTVIDSNGCEVNDCETVNTDGAAPVASFVADVTSGCDNLTVTFTDGSSNTPTEWSWTFGDGGISDEPNPVHEYAAPGLYTVILVATNLTGSNDIEIEDYIIVGETPTIDYSTTPQNNAPFVGGTISVNVTGGQEPYDIVWDHDAMETGLELTDLFTGDYYLTVTEDNGCSANEHIFVGLAIYVQQFTKELSIYPNPTNAQLNVISDGEIIENLTIVNVLGEIVYQSNEKTKQIRLDVQEFAVGTYFIKVNFADNSIVRKFIKQ